MLPVDPSWQIIVSSHHFYTIHWLQHRYQIEFPKDNTVTHNFLAIHSCTSSIDIHLTSGLNHLMLIEPSGDAPTSFDAAVHKLLLTAPMDYNDI